MAFSPTQDAEPIPGYQLVEKLGTGGFGEVWKATAPGGLLKAVKIIFGNLEGRRAEQELKALKRIKQVRHPFLLSLERFEVCDGQLMIVTELADKSLADVFEEYRSVGSPGIPRDELLTYLRDAAEALDYMEETRGLQHLDVKPQNLLLVAGRIKVADFGLVRELSGSGATSANGITPLYATPEAFDGKVSRYSDQYSLAIVYQEMLTGMRPFPGTTAVQLAAQHLTGRPVLNALPPHDRPIVARALAKVPEQRFANCRELIAQLVQAPAMTPVPVPSPVPETQRSLPTTRPSPVDLRPAGGPAKPEGGVTLESTVICRPDSTASAGALSADKINVFGRDKQTGGQSVRPTFYLGMGGLAGRVLCQLKRRLARQFGNLSAAPFFQFLFLDVDRAAIRQALAGMPNETLSSAEVLLTALQPPAHYRDRSGQLRRWLERRWQFGIPRSLCTEGIRPLGRLALMDNLGAVRARCRAAVSALTSPEARAAASSLGLSIREQTPRIFLIASVSGGTGGGMVVEAAYVLRQLLTDLGVAAHGICGLLLHATGKKPAEREMACVNAMAALTELAHYGREGNSYPGDPDFDLRPSAPGCPPFEDCYLIQLGEGLDATVAESGTAMVAEYLAFDSTAVGGAVLDTYRENTRCAEVPAASEISLRTFGLQQLHTAVDYLADKAAVLLCRQVVALWTAGGEPDGRQALEAEAEQRANVLGLEGDTLAKRLQARVTTTRGDDLTARLSWALQEDGEDSEPELRNPNSSESFTDALARLEQALGRAKPRPDELKSEEISLSAVLRAHAEELENNLGRSLAEWLRTLVESPGRRMWAAHYLVDWFAQRLLAVSDAIAARRTEVHTERRKLLRELNQKPASSVRKRGTWLRRRRVPAATRSSILVTYYQLCVEEAVLERTRGVLSSLDRSLVTFRYELAACQERVRALGRTIAGSVRALATEEPKSRPGATLLVPGKVATVAEAEMAVLQSLGPEQTRQFDEIVQRKVLDPHGGLWAAAQGETQLDGSRDSLADRLRDTMLAEARGMIRTLLTDCDAASLLLERFGGLEAAWQALTAHLEAALPPAATADRPKQLILTLPHSSAGEVLRIRAQQAGSQVPLAVLDSESDVLICYEMAGIPLGDALSSIVKVEPAHAALTAKVWTRLDVPWRSGS